MYARLASLIEFLYLFEESFCAGEYAVDHLLVDGCHSFAVDESVDFEKRHVGCAYFLFFLGCAFFPFVVIDVVLIELQ